MTTSDSDSIGGDIVYTPAGTESPSLHPKSLPPTSSSGIHSPTPLRLASLPLQLREELSPVRQTRKEIQFQEEDHEDDEHEYSDHEMDVRPPIHHRPSGGQSHLPLLQNDKREDRGRLSESSYSGVARPDFGSRRNTFRSRSPSFAQPENSTKRKYIIAALCLLVCLVTFVVQTETAVYIQHELKWNKAYCMLWMTHGSWSLLWPTQLLIIRIQKRKLSWTAFWRRHKSLLRTTAQMIVSQDLQLSPETLSRSPWPYMFKTTSFITIFLTVAGASWYIAVNMTSPSDLSAIYNCNAFFAYVFSIMLLHDKVRFDKVFSVGLAILGVLVVVYGDNEEPKHGSHSGGATNPNHDGETSNKFLGNLIIGIGAVMYGLYEVLYKKYACPPEGCSPGRGVIFANTFGSMIGTFTLCVLWIPLPILHYTGIETFELPRGKTAGLLAISTLSNATFSGAFLVLMSLTSPVLGSVAALLTIFLVALTDYFLTGKPLSPAAIAGGLLIIVAFVLLSWATYKEMQEDQTKREAEEDKVFDPDDIDGELDDDLEDVQHSRRKGSRRGSKRSGSFGLDSDDEDEFGWKKRDSVNKARRSN